MMESYIKGLRECSHKEIKTQVTEEHIIIYSCMYLFLHHVFTKKSSCIRPLSAPKQSWGWCSYCTMGLWQCDTHPLLHELGWAWGISHGSSLTESPDHPTEGSTLKDHRFLLYTVSSNNMTIHTRNMQSLSTNQSEEKSSKCPMLLFKYCIVLNKCTGHGGRWSALKPVNEISYTETSFWDQRMRLKQGGRLICEYRNV